jgi:phosphoribosylformylglycinamidine synthase
MKSAVIVFPASNCDRDVAVALEHASGAAPLMIWHRETELPPLDLIVVPGGFSYGDYLRAGAIAAHSPVMREVKARAASGVLVLGICNGFQILTEAHLLPGGMLGNDHLHFICRDQKLRVENAETSWTADYESGQEIHIPLKNMDGRYVADEHTLDMLEAEGRVAFRYVDFNPNGSLRDIAGITNEAGNVVGLMPHPEHAVEPLIGSGRTDGLPFFTSILKKLVNV